MRFGTGSLFVAPRLRGARFVYRARTQRDLLIAEVPVETVRRLRRQFRADPDRGFQVLSATPLSVAVSPQPLNSDWSSKSLRDVTAHIGASVVWPQTRGVGVRIAVIDSGISQSLKEIPRVKRSRQSRSFINTLKPTDADPWHDNSGHGSMVAAIAAGTSSFGGRYDGVAPDATLISCKTRVDAVDVYLAFDRLAALLKDRRTVSHLVILCAFALDGPPSPSDTAIAQLVELVKLAADRGALIVFAAGNSHPPKGWNDSRGTVAGTSIWGPSAMEDVLCLGSVSELEDMSPDPAAPNAPCHHCSSRGPGVLGLSFHKPDCVAPTYGETVWGNGYVAMRWWGTSGAAAQAAGVAALIWARFPQLTAAEVRKAIRHSCKGLNLAPEQCGFGRIDCDAALQLASSM